MRTRITTTASFLNKGVKDTVFCVMRLVDILHLGPTLSLRNSPGPAAPSRAITFTAVGFCLLKQISRVQKKKTLSETATLVSLRILAFSGK